jgi:hypothetical protein
MRIPCCPSCQNTNEACPPGDLSNWFVVWPNSAGFVGDGHATGWIVQAGGGGAVYPVQAAGAEGLIYEFEH